MADLVPSGTSVAHLGMRRGPLLRLRQDRFMVLRSYGKGAARVAAPGAYAVASSRLIAGLISSASIGRPRLCPSGVAFGWITGESARRAWEKGTASRHGCHLPVSGLGTPKVPGITLWPRPKTLPDSSGMPRVSAVALCFIPAECIAVRRRHYLRCVRAPVVTAPRAVLGRSHLPMGRALPSPNPTRTRLGLRLPAGAGA